MKWVQMRHLALTWYSVFQFRSNFSLSVNGSRIVRVCRSMLCARACASHWAFELARVSPEQLTSLSTWLCALHWTVAVHVRLSHYSTFGVKSRLLLVFIAGNGWEGGLRRRIWAAQWRRWLQWSRRLAFVASGWLPFIWRTDVGLWLACLQWILPAVLWHNVSHTILLGPPKESNRCTGIIA